KRKGEEDEAAWWCSCLNATGAAENNNLIQAQAPAKTADFVNDARRPRGPHIVRRWSRRSWLRCIWQPVALSGHSDSACERPLAGVKRHRLWRRTCLLLIQSEHERPNLALGGHTQVITDQPVSGSLADGFRADTGIALFCDV